MPATQNSQKKPKKARIPRIPYESGSLLVVMLWPDGTEWRRDIPPGASVSEVISALLQALRAKSLPPPSRIFIALPEGAQP